MAFRHYIQAEGKLLRCGYTTGTCAALAAAGAAELLLTGKCPESLCIMTPKGIEVTVEPQNLRLYSDTAECGVYKDGGDDTDVTNGALIMAAVRRIDGDEILILGGEGVGTVTKPGLDQSVGASAINRVPREMIGASVQKVCKQAGYTGGMEVTISVPNGALLAKKTFNPRLGIVGGISILGTSGIVEPMSAQALVDSVKLELRQNAALGHKKIIITPGNYGADFLAARGMTQNIPNIKCSNYVGAALDEAGVLGFEQVLLVGHVGKFVKLAGGIMNTHSREADCRAEIFCAHAAICGADAALCRKLMQSVTADACIALLDEAKIRSEVMRSIMASVEDRVCRRVGGKYRVGVIMFSNEYGILGECGDTEGIWE